MNLTRRSALTGATVGGLMLAGVVAEAQERHPKIRNAIRALEAARDDMRHAAHDFGGHRVDALKACDNAIEQLRLALQFDRK